MDDKQPTLLGSNQAFLDVRRSLLQRLWSLQCQIEHTRCIARRYGMERVVDVVAEAQRPLTSYFNDYGISVMESDEGKKEMNYWIDRLGEYPRVLW